MKYYSEAAYCKLTDAAAISLEPRIIEYNASGEAKESAKRFMRAATFLPEDGFVGLQIDAQTLASVSFSSPGSGVTAEDVAWIFGKCATIGEGPSAYMKDLYENNRKVYALKSIKGSERDDMMFRPQTYDPFNDVYEDDDEVSGSIVKEMFQMMADAGAVVRMIAGRASGDNECLGAVLISLPSEITLRMRSMLTIAFPHAEAVEVFEHKNEEEGIFPDDMFFGWVKEYLYTLMDRAEKIEKDKEKNIRPFRINEEGKYEDQFDIADEDGSDLENSNTDTESFTSIERLDFSVRTYNCLKRAGIDSVEKLRDLSFGELKRIRNLGMKSIEEIREKLTAFKDITERYPSDGKSYMTALDELIGLNEVKEQVKKIASYAKMKHEMGETGRGDVGVVLNMEFIGNPGTAKTTVARTVAGILYEIGLLSSNEVIEVGRADLVANYVGQTATKVRDVFRRAKGKLLFIDEAYSLADCYSNSFGDEAITTIVQEMENNRDDTVVIFAGYPDNMKEFFSRNPGLRSRVPFTVNFCDYSPEEMLLIAESEAKKKGFSISSEACEKVKNICTEATLRSVSGNGRFCRNMVENAILRYASRVYRDDCPEAKKDLTLIPEDFIEPVDPDEKKKPVIGF